MPRAAAKSSDRLVCRGCKLPIAGAKDRRAAVWLAIGPMHAACHAETRAAIDRTVADALTAGTHTNEQAVHVCGECRQWRTIWHKTQDGTELCWDCTPEGDR